MLRVSGLIRVLQSDGHIKKDLLVSQSPVRHREHKYWCKMQYFQGIFDEFLIVHWGLSVPVVNAQVFDNVKVSETEACNEKENWNEGSVHETYEDGCHYGTVLVVHHVLRACVKSNELKLCSFFGELFRLLTAGISFVHPSKHFFLSECNQKLDVGHAC